MKIFNLALKISTILLLTISCTDKPSDDFVKIDGNHFMIGNHQYVYTGVNLWQGAYLGADLIEGGKERLIRELDQMQDNGITNIRVTASAEASDLEMAVTPAFVDENGQVNEKLLKGLDYLLNEMSKREMKAIMVMNNYWQWSGGMAQYVVWQTGEKMIDPDATGNWHGFMCLSGTFYQNSKAWEPFFNYLKNVITRTNTINNKPYNNDPTIMSWQLANEPRPHPQSLENPELLKGYYQWIDSTARLIHKLAPYQLVSTGNEGLAGCLFDSAIYVNAHAFSSIDYMTFHIWPKNWSWYNAGNPDSTIQTTLQNTNEYFSKHIAFANHLNKPLVLEEFGMGRDGELCSDSAKVNYRDIFLSHVFKLVEKDVSNNGPVAGTNVWAWGGEGRAQNPEALWIEGTDFTGDPPQEPQGLNSIFNTDISSLELFKNHNLQLKAIIHEQ